MEGDWGQGRPSGGEEFNPLSAMVKAVDMQEERNNGSYQFSGGAELVRLSGQVINTFNQHQGGQPASGEISSCQQDRSVPLSAATSQARENQVRPQVSNFNGNVLFGESFKIKTVRF